MNVARNNANVAWTNWSLVKVRSNRGENWLLANCKVTTVRENVRDVTVIKEDAIAPSNDRAASASPSNSQLLTAVGSVPSTPVSRCGNPIPSSSATTTVMGLLHG